MVQVFLDATPWTRPADFYAALFPQIGAPAWHGDSLDALWDSMVTGDINAISPPYEIELVRTGTLNDEMRSLMRDFAKLIADGRREGVLNVLRCTPPL